MFYFYRNSLVSQWLSKEDLEKLTVEKLSEHEVNYILLNIYTFNVPIYYRVMVLFGYVP